MTQLKKTLSSFQVWALAVGLVISGEYFGWSYGWAVSGPYGFLAATVFVTVLYIGLVLCLTELSTAIPDSGGPLTYATRALGAKWGRLAAITTLMEFIFAPPAVAFALSSYLKVIFPTLPSEWAAIGLIVFFCGVNLFETGLSVRFEAVVTVFALTELVLFIGIGGSHFQLSNFLVDADRGGISGFFAAIPYAIWFFLAIEGIVFASEEIVNPEKVLPKSMMAAILTLVALAFGVMFVAGGAGDWKKLSTLDYPIPEAVAMAIGHAHPWVKLFAGIGMFGLIASLNGILFGCSRQIYGAAKSGVLPKIFQTVSARGVPTYAVLVSGAVGIIGVLSGKTSELISLAAMGALTMYLLSTLSVIVLRKKEPALHRPFRIPFYPFIPWLTLAIALISLVSVFYIQFTLGLIFLALVLFIWGVSLKT